MNRAVANIFGAGVLLVGVAYAWLLTGDFEQDAAKNYPYAVLAFTGVAAALWLFRSIARLRAGHGTGSGKPALGTIGGYAALAGTLLYGGLVVYFGYVVPSVIYLAVGAFFLGGRRWGLIGATAILFPLALYTFLVYGFDRPLPF